MRPSSIVECVALHAEAHPDKLALADYGSALSYSQLWQLVCSRAASLGARGFGTGDKVAIGCDQTASYLAWVLAVQLVGAVAVPFEKGAAPALVETIVEQTGCRAVIARDKAKVASALTEDVAFVEMGSVDDVPVAACAAPEALPSGDDVAEILFSTGTTGKSKGIVISHRNNMAIAENITCGVEMKPDNVEVVPMPLSHSHALRTSYANLANGSSVVIADGVLALKRLFNLMDDYSATALDISPSMLAIIFKLSKDRLGDYSGCLDYVQLGSAPLAEADKERLRRLLPTTRLYDFYGSTEAGRSCLYDFATMVDKPGCIGRPAVNARFVVVDENRNVIESSPDNLGRLASSGDINMVGYYNDPELTAATMANGFIYTNDLGYIDDEGLVYMVGRADDVINFGGVKISPEEIESAVRDNPLVKDCACVPLPDALSGQIPGLCISLEDGAVHDERAFKLFLAQAIDASKQPQRVMVVDEIPRTFNGKVIRREVIEMFKGAGA